MRHHIESDSRGCFAPQNAQKASLAPTGRPQSWQRRSSNGATAAAVACDTRKHRNDGSRKMISMNAEHKPAGTRNDRGTAWIVSRVGRGVEASMPQSCSGASGAGLGPAHDSPTGTRLHYVGVPVDVIAPTKDDYIFGILASRTTCPQRSISFRMNVSNSARLFGAGGMPISDSRCSISGERSTL